MSKNIPNAEILNLNGIPIELTRKRIKNINLRIDRDGRVKLSVPAKCPMKTIQVFLHEKSAWILKYTAHKNASTPAVAMQFDNGERHLFLGKSLQLTLHEHILTPKVVINDNYLMFFIKKSTTLEEKQTLLQKFYRMQMIMLLPELIKKWESIIGVQVLEWRIKSMKTRWGTCNTVKKRIWLNLHLIQKPLHCLEYVLVHEMVHLLEASHNKRFYQLMSHFLPQWRACKMELMAPDIHLPEC